MEECLFCGSEDVVRHGFRFGNAATKQLFKCNSCQKVFSEGEKSRFPKEIIEEALRNRGESLSSIQKSLQERFSVRASKVTISNWLKRFSNKRGVDMGEDYFKNKRVLVTGGTGTIGRAIVKELLYNHNPAVIRLFDLDETEHFELEQELAMKNPELLQKVRFLLGDVKDKQRMDLAMKDVDIVLHLAALKHVRGCEYNPFEAVKTNIIGTQNVIESAIEHNVERVIYTSSDKAAYPNNTMGATKLVAERLVTSANYYKGSKKTIFASVRFGNVMGSRGSVIPLFKAQIRNGGPVTVTDPGMSRFMMSLSEAVRLVFKCTELAQGGEIFILKMPVVKIGDLAEIMINELGPKVGKAPAEVKSHVIGLKEGETIYEELMTEEEASRSVELQDMFVIPPFIAYGHNVTLSYPDARPVTRKGYESKNENPLTKEELRILLHKAGAFEP